MSGSAGIERSDSVTLDPHKGLFLPYGTGGLVVRDAEALRDAHYEGAAYLQDLPPTGDLPNYSEYSAELSRDWRGLRVWMPLQLHGVDAFRDALDEKLDLAVYLAEALRADPRIEVCWEPQLTVIPFRLAGEHDDESQRAFLRDDQRVEAGVPVLDDDRRSLHPAVCIVCHRTHKDRIEECVEIIVRNAAAELTA